MAWKRKNPGQPGWVLLVFAALLLLLLAGAQGYVSWAAQYGFIFAAKHAHLPSVLEALGLDTAAIIFAILGLAHARMGRSAVIERTLNLLCVGGSMSMNLLSAQLGSPRSVAVYVLPAVLYAACSDRLIATVGHMSGVQDPASMWRVPGMTFLYLLRLVVAFPSTATGMRRRLLELTPLPEKVPTFTPRFTPTGTISAVYENGERVPESKTEGVPENTAPVPRRPLDEILDEAKDKYAPEIEAGTVPGHREVRRELGVGASRAEKVREHLAGLVAARDESQGTTVEAAEDDTDTHVFSAVGGGHPSPGQQVTAYQSLPVTPQGR